MMVRYSLVPTFGVGQCCDSALVYLVYDVPIFGKEKEKRPEGRRLSVRGLKTACIRARSAKKRGVCELLPQDAMV